MLEESADSSRSYSNLLPRADLVQFESAMKKEEPATPYHHNPKDEGEIEGDIQRVHSKDKINSDIDKIVKDSIRNHKRSSSGGSNFDRIVGSSNRNDSPLGLDSNILEPEKAPKPKKSSKRSKASKTKAVEAVDDLPASPSPLKAFKNKT